MLGCRILDWRAMGAETGRAGWALWQTEISTLMARSLDHQAALYEDLPPVREGNPLFCHQDFLEKMEENRASTVGRRASLLMQRLLVDLRRRHSKPASG